MRKDDISAVFNFQSRGLALNNYMLTLTRPTGNPQAQAEEFSARLTRWLTLQGDDARGSAEAPVVAAPAPEGNASVALRCTETTLARIERQFAGDILRVDPPARHVRGAIYPPRVDPWDVSKW